ncbi:hypothetical protein [Paenibacillus sp.]|uniref:hypothetical protein n=1 Tax=Paenibacillus sp. TaxID=58172 RepID=UPI0028126C20|nr:hypothetical protein [Paenibacillus sp.]
MKKSWIGFMAAMAAGSMVRLRFVKPVTSFGTQAFDVRKTFDSAELRASDVGGRSINVALTRGDTEQVVVSFAGRANAKAAERLDVSANVQDGKLMVEPAIPDSGFDGFTFNAELRS